MSNRRILDQMPSKYLQEYGEDEKPVVAPAGVPIIRPYKDLTHFWPNDQSDRDDVSWVFPYEVRYLKPLGERIAQVFHVNLIDDDEYIGMPEEAKATQLSCVLTRSQLRDTGTGIFTWDPICVVVKYMVMVAVQIRLDQPNNRIDIVKALLWANSQQTYVPVFDEKAGKIENPGVLLQILERYAGLEGLT